ncbi:Uma2 family endonuclease [Cyclobacterium jeungdonense]|uniref:Uma2 family endonuclease n=1 Tax=Cyclobacterium jeungdonense TaxID=708087 RepID=A0ABT8C6M9_9BACT|nr:Uma2 family endonuclease [Cyclobacterium jeungdonense]MDN3687283.1 Uma2 family endonuclease [Cyclobacterium jeungdonense]
MEKPPDKVKEPFSAYGRFSYADYLSWQLDEMVELIRGKVFKQAAAAPRRVHQEISMVLSNKLYEFLKGKICKVYVAPFDVRLPVSSRKHEDIDTVVQPDICVVCNPEKLDELGCVGAPDLIVEILSPGNNKKELQLKYEVYEASGVKEYWVVHPDERSLLIYTLGNRVSSQALTGFELNLDEVFGEL